MVEGLGFRVCGLRDGSFPIAVTAERVVIIAGISSCTIWGRIQVQCVNLGEFQISCRFEDTNQTPGLLLCSSFLDLLCFG